MHLKLLSAKWRPFCPGRDELILGHYNVFDAVAPAGIDPQQTLCRVQCWYSQGLIRQWRKVIHFKVNYVKLHASNLCTYHFHWRIQYKVDARQYIWSEFCEVNIAGFERLQILSCINCFMTFYCSELSELIVTWECHIYGTMDNKLRVGQSRFMLRLHTQKATSHNPTKGRANSLTPIHHHGADSI